MPQTRRSASFLQADYRTSTDMKTFLIAVLAVLILCSVPAAQATAREMTGAGADKADIWQAHSEAHSFDPLTNDTDRPCICNAGKGHTRALLQSQPCSNPGRHIAINNSCPGPGYWFCFYVDAKAYNGCNQGEPFSDTDCILNGQCST